MKKVFCMVMSLVLLLPINSLGFEGRADDEVNMQGCSHIGRTLLSSYTTYSRYNDSNHRVNVHKRFKCTSCGTIMQVTETYYESHDCVPDGSCNGSTTTVRTICMYCDYIKNVITYPCRGVSCIYQHDTISGTHTPDFCCDHRHAHD